MEKGILFLTITAACLWILLDEFFGTKKISGVAQNMTPKMETPLDKVTEGVKDFFTFDMKLDSKPKEKIEQRNNVNKKIDDNPNMDSKLKQELKKSVDKFYGVQEA